MPSCSFCGADMIQTHTGNSGKSGGAGNRYHCPYSPHPKCGVCGRTMIREATTWNSGKGRFNRGAYVCVSCGQKGVEP